MGRGRGGWLLAACVVVGLVAPIGRAAAEPPHRAPIPRRELSKPAKATPSPEIDPSTVVVRFKPGAGKASAAARHGSSLRAEVAGTAFNVVSTNGTRPEALIAQLKSDPDVADAQPNYIRHAFEVPNDTFYAQYQSPYLNTIHAAQAWGMAKGSSTLKIAIVDSGVDLGHPDLAGRLLPGWDFVHGTSSPQDDKGHGTEVASIAAAGTNNGAGIAGLAWNASIIPVKVLDSNGNGTDANIAAGIIWAADHGARIINLSLGGPGDSQILHDAVSYALNHDVLVVAAAGNASADIPLFPAAQDGVVAVGATDAVGDAAWFSEHGPWIDLAAPGIDIAGAYPNNSYVTDEGTSFSAPIVSGIAALVRSQHPTWTQAQVFTWLQATATDRGPQGVDDFYGYGLVDAWAAVGGPGAVRPGLPPGDGFEPNDVPGRARSLAPGTSVGATVSPEGDTDWFSFVAPVNGSMSFGVNPPPVSGTSRALEFDPVIEAYGPDDHLVDSADAAGIGGAETLTIATISGATYRVAVSNFAGSRGPGSYTFSSTFSTVSTPLFGTPVFYGGADRDTSVAMGDFNDDDRIDIATSNHWIGSSDVDGKVLIFLQQADGSLAGPTKLPTHLEFGDLGSLAAGDVNLDGKTDLALAMPTGTDLFLQSNGALQPPSLVDAPSYFVLIADVDGNGRGDLLSASGTGLAWFKNTPTGFEKVPITTEDVTGAWTAGDINSDNRLDVILWVDSPDTVVRIYSQQPDHTFVSANHQGVANGGPPHDIVVSDVTADGRNDIVVSTGSAQTVPGSVDVFPQLPNGTLGATSRHAGYFGAGEVRVADMDVDGVPDVLVGHQGQNLGVFRGRSDGSLASEEVYHLPVEGAIDIGDVTGDGRPDVALGSYNSGLVVVPSVATNGPSLWIRSSSPADFATNVPTTSAPTVTFARSLLAGSVTSSTVQLIDGVTSKPIAATPSYNAGTKTVTLTPAVPLNTKHAYQVRVGAVVDANTAETFTDGYTFRFTSAPPPSFPFRVVTIFQRDQNAPGYPDNQVPFGSPGCVSVSGDWDGNGTSTVGTYCNGTWYLRNSNTSGPPDMTLSYGAAGYTPVVGNWDGVGGDGIGVYVNGQWLLRNSATPGQPDIRFAYGAAGYQPVVGNWDGNGGDGIGVYINGSWFLRNPATAGQPQIQFAYGAAGYVPVTGNWDGTAGDTIGIVTGAAWYLRNSNTAGAIDLTVNYGDSAYRQVPGDWDGNGTTTVGVAVG